MEYGASVLSGVEVVGRAPGRKRRRKPRGHFSTESIAKEISAWRPWLDLASPALYSQPLRILELSKGNNGNAHDLH